MSDETKTVDERREELEGMQPHHIRQRALELNFPHRETVLTEPPELIDFIIQKEIEMGELEGEDGEAPAKPAKGKGKGKGGGAKPKPAPPTAEERAAKRAAAAGGTGKGKGKGKGKSVAAPAEVDLGEDDGDPADSCLMTSEDAEEIKAMMGDILNRLDNLGTFSEGLSEKLGSLEESVDINEGWLFLMAAVMGSIPKEAKESIEAGRDAMKEFSFPS